MDRQIATVDRGRRITLHSESLVIAADRVDQKTFTSRLKLKIYVVEPDGLYKRCSKCREYWPADSEFFYSVRSQADGLHAWCKACYQEWRYPNGRKTDSENRKQLEAA